jgi:hypothetical protein
VLAIHFDGASTHNSRKWGIKLDYQYGYTGKEIGGTIMRRKIIYTAKPKQKAMAYTAALILLSVYGIPRMPKIHPGLGGTFVTLWILFAALAVAANIYFLVGADKERSRMLEVTDSVAAAPVIQEQHRRAF